jgi:hypothetical protein
MQQKAEEGGELRGSRGFSKTSRWSSLAYLASRMEPSPLSLRICRGLLLMAVGGAGGGGGGMAWWGRLLLQVGDFGSIP